MLTLATLGMISYGSYSVLLPEIARAGFATALFGLAYFGWEAQGTRNARRSDPEDWMPDSASRYRVEVCEPLATSKTGCDTAQSQGTAPYLGAATRRTAVHTLVARATPDHDGSAS